MDNTIECVENIEETSEPKHTKSDTLEKLFPTVMKISEHQKKKKENKQKAKEEEIIELVEDDRPSYLKRAVPIKSSEIVEKPNNEIKETKLKIQTQPISEEDFDLFTSLFKTEDTETEDNIKDFPMEQATDLTSNHEEDLDEIDDGATEVLSQTKYEMLTHTIHKYDASYTKKLSDEDRFREKCLMNNIRRVLLDAISDRNVDINEKMNLVKKLGIVDANMSLLVKAS